MHFVVRVFTMPNQGPRQVYMYNHNRQHWPQMAPPPLFDGRLGQQMFMGAPFQANQAPRFRGPVGPPNMLRNQQHFFPGLNNNNNSPPVFRGGRGAFIPGPANLRARNVRHHGNEEFDEAGADVCFICGDFLQNCNEPGVHFCEGHPQKEEEGPQQSEESSQTSEEDLDTRLESLLQSLKGCLRNKYERVTDTLEKYVTDRIAEINSIHKVVVEEKAALETLKEQLETTAADLEKQEKELKEKVQSLGKDRENMDAELKKEKEELCRRWQQLRDEITRMEAMHELQKGRIKLDVGGRTYTTSLLTVTRDSESMLAAMFSGRHEVKTEQDGSIFIDRDGTHFRYILNYLRDGGLSVDALPRNRQILRELRNEAVFFQLHGLIQHIEKLL